MSKYKHINNIKKELFIIDSNKLYDVKDNVYGYFLDKNYSLSKDTSEIDTALDGLFIKIASTNQKIYINQDSKGSWGLYLYKEKDYFAISNSFAYLVDYIKNAHKITFNFDYANAFIASSLCSIAYKETLINEIQLLDRSATIEIDIDTKKLNILLNDYKENTINPCSKEGIELLDKWHDKWINIIQNICKKNKNIVLDLSGGIDSRLILALFVSSGVNLNNIEINTVKDKLHTHKEDYQIASKISKHFNFKLKTREHSLKEITNFSKPLSIYENEEINTIEDMINSNFYVKLGTNKEMYWHYKRTKEEVYYFPGAGGECIRTYWNYSPQELKHKLTQNKWNKKKLIQSMTLSVNKIINSAFDSIKEKQSKFGVNIPEEDLTRYLYKETRCRYHFGKSLVSAQFSNIYSLTPLMDRELCMLKLNDDKIHDKNLLVSIIFTRYSQDLLNFKFDSNRYIDNKTIAYAKEINLKYPYKRKVPTLNNHKNIIKKEKRRLMGKTHIMALLNKYILSTFYSLKNKKLFIKFFDEELFNKAIRYKKRHKYQPLSHIYPIIAICKFLNDTIDNNNNKDNDLANYILEQDIHNFDKIKIEFDYQYYKILEKLTKIFIKK